MKSSAIDIQAQLSPWQSIYAKIGKKLHEQLYRDVTKSPDLRPRLTFSGMLGVLIALIVDALAFVFLVSGIQVLLNADSWNLFAYLIGIVLIGLAIIAFPRFPKLKRALVPREQAPVLYTLTDQIARILGTKPVDGILINEQYGAYFTRVGWQQKRILALGLPLLLVLNSQERIALIAHELAHSVNGDFTRGFFVGSAIRSLIRWHQAVEGRGRFSVSARGFAIVLALFVAWPISGVINLLSHLSWHESQRAEYYADSLAAKAGGRSAMQSCLQKLFRAGEINFIINRGTVRSSRSDRPDILREIQQKVPADSIAYLDRPEQRVTDEEIRADATHPPLLYRIRFVGNLPYQEPLAGLSAYDRQKLDEELEVFRADVNNKLLDIYESRLYQ